jgi:hypothetical protein
MFDMFVLTVFSIASELAGHPPTALRTRKSKVVSLVNSEMVDCVPTIRSLPDESFEASQSHPH